MISLNKLTIGSDGFLVVCAPLAANYSFSGYPNKTCDVTGNIGDPADISGDDSIAIVICDVGCASWKIVDIYGVPGQRGSISVGSFFQDGHAERVPGHIMPKSVWNASDWYSLYGNYNATDMTPRKWLASVKPTLKPSSLISCVASSSGDIGSSLNKDNGVYVDLTYQMIYNKSLVNSDSVVTVVRGVEIAMSNVLVKGLFTICQTSNEITSTRALRERNLADDSQILGISAFPPDFISPGKSRLNVITFLLFYSLNKLTIVILALLMYNTTT